MKKGVPFDAERMLNNRFYEISNSISLQQHEGTASKQLEIRQIPSRIIDYALDPATSPGIIEVIFAEHSWKGLPELILQCPTTLTFRNFIPENGIIDQNTLLIKHVIVVTNWSNELKIFKATLENEQIHLMLYTAVTHKRK